MTDPPVAGSLNRPAVLAPAVRTMSPPGPTSPLPTSSLISPLLPSTAVPVDAMREPVVADDDEPVESFISPEEPMKSALAV